MNPLSILFAGEIAPVTLIGDTHGRIFVRALPQVHLHHVLASAEHKDRLVSLVCYFRAAPKKGGKDHPLDAAVRVAGAHAFPDVEVPAGYQPVPLGWHLNLADETLDRLYELAKQLNFTRAAKWGRDQIAAKKLVAPLQQAAMEQVMPLVEQMLRPLLARLSPSSSSTPSAPTSSALPASNC